MKSLSLSQPHVIIMVGIPGSGKSFFAEKFSEMFNAPFISLEKIMTTTGSSAKAARDCALYQLDELIKTKQSIIIDGLGTTRAERSDLAKKARAGGYKPLLVWVQVDETTAKNRATKRKASHQLSSDEFDHELHRFSTPTTVEHPVVISGKHTYATQAKVVLKKLSAPRASISAHSAAPMPRDQKQPDRRNIIIR